MSEELKAQLVECAKDMSVDDIVAAIGASQNAPLVEDPVAVAALLKKWASG